MFLTYIAFSGLDCTMLVHDLSWLTDVYLGMVHDATQICCELFRIANYMSFGSVAV